MDIEKVIREYIDGVIHLSLATSKKNVPWICEVHFVYDNDLNLYFRSRPSRRHSEEISSNERVAGNIVEQHSIDDDPRGVYFEGIAKVVNDDKELNSAYDLFHKRFDLDRDIINESKEDNGHKFYKILVDTFYLFDSRESTPSQKYVLPWRKK